MKNLIIRLEEPKDYRESEELTRAAFSREERIEEIGVSVTEHYMLHKLRGNDGISELTFVAELNGRLVGHIIYSSSSYIETTTGERIEVLNFGPLSVLPDYQKMGVGSALMKRSIQVAKELGYGAILFYGHPTYYPRFGFVEAKKFNITTKSGSNFPAFMGMELIDGYLDGVYGRYIEGDIFDEEITSGPAKEYDKLFEKEK